MFTKRSLGTALVAAGTVTILTGVAAPASIAGATTTTALTASTGCVNNLNLTFSCYPAISGGTAPYTATWSGSSTVRFSSASTTYANGTCYGYVTLTITVRDSAGATTAASKNLYCDPNHIQP